MPGRGIYDHVGWVDVFVNESTSVEPAKCGRQRHGEPEKSSDLHGLADKAIKGLTSGVLDNQHRPPALAHELHWPQRPRGSEGILEFVFVGETIDALERRMLRAGKDGDERVPIARGTVAPESAKGTSGVLPQHLYRVVFPTSPEQGGCLHLFVLFCRSRRLRSGRRRLRYQAPRRKRQRMAEDSRRQSRSPARHRD